MRSFLHGSASSLHPWDHVQRKQIHYEIFMSSNTKQDNQSCRTLTVFYTRILSCLVELEVLTASFTNISTSVEEEDLSRFNNEDRTTTYTQTLVTMETTSK